MNRNEQQGFTFVELVVVVVIVGVLAAFAVPKFITSVERSRAAEAFQYLSTLHTAQELHHARHGTYTMNRDDLELELPVLEHFMASAISLPVGTTLEKAWTVTLTRKETSNGYGSYTVVYTQDGFHAARSTISKLPRINPMDSGDR